MAGVGPADQAQALGRPQKSVDGGVGQLPAARGLQAQPRGSAVKDVKHAPVRHHENLFARVACSDLLHGVDDACLQL